MLLRASVEFFSSWGMELLVTQLHDHSKAVSMEALDILDEACEDKVNTHVTQVPLSSPLKAAAVRAFKPVAHFDWALIRHRWEHIELPCARNVPPT